MPRRTISFCPGEAYHLYNRGNNRERIVFERENYGYFLQLVRRHLLPVVDILAYCVMPNHYHLLAVVKEPSRPTSEVFKQTSDFSKKSEVSVSEAMRRLSIAYTKAINKRYGRVGVLFQGAFQAKLIPSERLLDLSCYLHHNPVAAGFVEHAADWPYSSARDYLGLRVGTLPTPHPVLAQLPVEVRYETYLRDYASRKEEEFVDLE